MRFKLPERHQIVSIWPLKYLAGFLTSPRLWAFRRHSVAFGVAWGLFCTYLPIPFQMVVATIGCLVMRINLPLALACVWVTNPITIPFFFYGAYLVGEWLLPSGVSVSIDDFSNLDVLLDSFTQLTKTVVLGCLILGSVLAVLGYIIAHLVWLIWARRRMVYIQQIRRLKKFLHLEKTDPSHPDEPHRTRDIVRPTQDADLTAPSSNDSAERTDDHRP